MKKFLFVALLPMLLVVGCSYDDSQLWEAMDEVKEQTAEGVVLTVGDGFAPPATESSLFKVVAYGMNTPAYFAYDDVAVRFDK